ncbi:hypothetical protein [Arenimonas caeni]|jgi:hypothetical protein|uniref:hypothetical protein n=1 Tax=Arenimonas caeni TaxID=2058085 RepID=UPI002A3697C9|nr:hypothetical protein [Arenimonas caeni]MDY0021881.1 hypothetical protein [Arenimonas caeni]
MGTVRVVVVEARPAENSPEFDTVAGSFVSVYTTADSDDQALAIATAEIADAGWVLLTVENEYMLTKSEAEAIPEALPYYEQVLLDDVVLVFDMYPHGGEQPDVLH